MQILLDTPLSRFQFVWGFAPKGSLKYKKGKEIERFIKKELGTCKQVRKETMLVVLLELQEMCDKAENEEMRVLLEAYRKKYNIHT